MDTVELGGEASKVLEAASLFLEDYRTSLLRNVEDCRLSDMPRLQMELKVLRRFETLLKDAIVKRDDALKKQKIKRYEPIKPL